MKRRRRSRSVLAVSLFPFLAVLICTLGVLIVLLVLAVKVADSNAASAQNDADTEMKSQLSVVQMQLEERQIQIDGLQDVRPEALKRLEEARATRSHFETEFRKLRREARSLAETLLQLENQRQGFSADVVSDAELEQLKTEIAEAEESLAKKRETAKQVPEVVWSIQPYQGSSGTDRRPIFVECTADRLVLQPLDIVITQQDLRKAVFPGNMLDAALLTIREYWQRFDLEGEAGRAYPLIVVRPDGAKTFQVVKSSLKAWDDEYGYEIIDADKKISFGERDPELAKEVEAAIKEARQRQQRLTSVALERQRRARHSQLSRRPRSERRPGLTVSRNGGGFVFNGVRQGSDIGNDDHTSGDRESPSNSQAAWQQNLDSQFSDGESHSDANSGFESDANVAGGVAGGTQASGETQLSSSSAQDGPTSDASQSRTNGSENAQSSNQSLARTRGKNWALPSQSAGATPYVRPLRIICFTDRLIIKGTRGDSTVLIEDATGDAVDELVNEIWAQIESWGVAGQNSYWKPQLRISVMPGSHHRFKELRILLADSGILVEGA